MRRILVGLLSAVVMLDAGALAADTGANAPPAQPAPATPVRDNARGFEMLFKFGLPDVGKAAYVKLDLRGGMEAMQTLYYLQQLHLQGNAWLLGTNPDGSASLVVDQARRVSVSDAKAAAAEMAAKQKDLMARMRSVGGQPDEALQMEWMALLEGNNRKASGTWRDADLARDVTNLIALLAKRDGAARPGMDPIEAVLQQAGGSCFLFAAHLYRRGMTNEANRIVTLLNERARDPRQLMVQTVALMADSQYSELYHAFLADGRWDGLAAGLSNLMTRFQATWPGQAAVKRLAGQVQARIAAPVPPPLQGEALTVEDQALAADMATVANDTMQISRYLYYGLWLLPDTNRMAGMRGKETHSVFARITARGIQAIPVLAAMLKDEYLLAVDSRTLGMGGGGFMNYAMLMEQANPAMQEQMWNQMARPVSRGDIARILLNAVIPRDLNQQRRGGEQSPDEMAEEAMILYAACSNKTPLAIARYYLTSGDQSKEQQGLQYMIQHATNDADFAFLEQQLLKGNPQETQYQVQMYATQRRDKARDLVAKYIAQLPALKSPSEYADMPAATQARYAKQEAAQRAVMTNQLWQLVGATSTNPAVSIEKCLETMAAGNPNAMQYMSFDYQAFEKEDVATLVTKILQAAVKATNATGRSTLIDLASQQGMRDMYRAMDPSRAAATNPPAKPLKLDQHAALWRTLAEDQRTIPGMEMQMFYSAGMMPDKISDKVHLAVETLYPSPDTNGVAGQTMMNYYQRMAMQGEDGDVPDWTDMAARGKARLAGVAEDALPPLSSAARVNDARRAQIAADLAKAAQPAAVIAKLSKDELQALRQMCAREEKLNAIVAPYANRIGTLKVNLADAATAAWVKAIEGSVMTTNTIAALRDIAEASVRTGRCIMVFAMRGLKLDGYTLQVEEIDPAKPGPSRQMLMGGPFAPFGSGGNASMSMVNAMVNANEVNGNAVWPVQGIQPPVAAKTGDDDALEADAQGTNPWEQNDDNFWDALSTALGPDHNVGVPTMISLTGINGPAMRTMAEQAPDTQEEGMGGMGIEPFMPTVETVE